MLSSSQISVSCSQMTNNYISYHPLLFDTIQTRAMLNYPMIGSSTLKVNISDCFPHIKSFSFRSGWYFEHNLVRAKLARTVLSTVVNEVNRKRVAYFTGSGKKRRTLCLEGLTSEMCVKTNADGLLKKQFRLSNDDVQHLRVPGGKVEYFVSTNDGNLRSKGEIFLCDDNGISIISDIVNNSLFFVNN